jgi:hypothetical protein
VSYLRVNVLSPAPQWAEIFYVQIGDRLMHEGRFENLWVLSSGTYCGLFTLRVGSVLIYLRP